MSIVFIFLLGLAFGSFANVLSDRLPKGQDILFSRSRCDHCRRVLTWSELIPVLSWLSQNGRCRTCRAKLSLQYPLVELVTAGIFVVVYYFNSSLSLNLLISLHVIAFSLLVIFIADSKYQIIPDSLLVTSLISVTWYHLARGTTGYQFLIFLLWGLGASLFFLLLYLVTRGRGIGLGDAKFGFLMGFFLGFPGTIIALYFSFLTGALIGVTMIIVGAKKLKSPIAFGPFLITGTLIAYAWGSIIWQWWRRII